MKTSRASVLGIATLAVAVSFVCFGRPLPSRSTTPSASAAGAKLLGRLPVAFVPNLGQWPHAARYVTRVGAMTVFLEDKGWTFTLVERGPDAEKASARGVAVRMTFVGASEPTLVAEDRLPGRHNYFLGNDPSKWRSDVPLYASVRYRDVHAGIDVRAREHDGHFEYDLLLQPGADLDPVEIAVEGIEGTRVEGDALVMETQLGPVRMPAPLSWEEGPSGERSLIACRYVMRGNNVPGGVWRFGFEAPGRQPGWALVVDPGLVWSTFLGGTGGDDANALAVDTQGAATVAGSTGSPDFPTTPGAFDTSYNGNQDAFVTRFSPSGSSLVYSTFLGGTGPGLDNIWALAIDAQGAATVAGETLSTNFPITPGAFDTTYNGGADAFVTRLSPTGSSLVYSTFLGGTASDHARALAVDAQGVATVAGSTDSTNFPTTPGAFDTSFNGNIDAFVTRLSPTGSTLVHSTFLGGTGADLAYALALDTTGATRVVGRTSSADLPTTPGAFDTTYSGNQDAFVSRLSPTGSSLVYSTFLGGTGVDDAWALAVDAQGTATVAGLTYSTDFPTTSGAFDTSFNGGSHDAFVTRLSPTGSSLVYSTFLGGTGREEPRALALDAQGAATVAGITDSADFPTTPGAFDTSHNGHFDAFVTRLSPTGSNLAYSTFLGGAETEGARALTLDAQGVATVAGFTFSTDFPTTPGAFDTSFNGGTDAFVTRLDMLPTGVAAFGRSTAGCTGPLAISVTSMPSVGNAGFALTCGNAAPNTMGLLALAAAGLATPIPVLGVDLWLDPFSAFFVTFGANSDARGACEVGLPIPSQPWFARRRLFAQFVWAGPTSPPPCPPLGLSASNALDITTQP